MSMRWVLTLTRTDRSNDQVKPQACHVIRGDVKTAFLQGSLDSRDCYCSPPKDVRNMLGMKEDEILQLQRAAYGLRNAPRQWYNRMVKDFLGDAEVAWVQHKLDRCVFVCHCCAVVVYVDDFWVIGVIR
eukprot:3075199-Amphidinium_carterae.4